MGDKRQSVPSPRTYGVLCVDDHVPGLKIRKIFLESFGYTVEVAESGPAALELAAKGRFDAAILDYRMPGMNGLELARALRQRCPALPLIVLSGYRAELPKELHGLVSGYVAKGSHPEALLRSLEKVLGGAPERRGRLGNADSDELLAQSQAQVTENKRQIRRALEATGRWKSGRRRSA